MALHPERQRLFLRLLNLEEDGLAERVGFGLRPPVENKELSGIPLPPDPPEPLKGPGRRTYCARGAIYVSYMAY